MAAKSRGNYPQSIKAHYRKVNRREKHLRREKCSKRNFLERKLIIIMHMKWKNSSRNLSKSSKTESKKKILSKNEREIYPIVRLLQWSISQLHSFIAQGRSFLPQALSFSIINYLMTFIILVGKVNLKYPVSKLRISVILSIDARKKDHNLQSIVIL